MKEATTQTEYKGSIKKRLRSIILLVVFISATLGYASFIFWHMSNQQKKAIELSRSVAHVLSQDFAKLLLLNELSVASDITAKLKSFDALNFMVLYNNEKTPIFQYHKNNKGFVPKKLQEETAFVSKSTDQNLQIFMPAQYEGVELGKILFNFELDSLTMLLKRDTPFLLSIALFMFFISYLLSEIFAKRFIAPILKLVAFLENIELVTLLKQKLQTQSKDEFGKLYDEVNTMLLRLFVAQEEQKIASMAFDTQSGMTITDANQKILRINKAFTAITGYTQEELLGQTPRILNSGYHDKAFYQAMYADLEKNNYWSGEVYNRHKSGEIYPEQLTIQVVLNENGEVQYYVAAILDLTLQKNAEKKLDFLSKHDPLTSLANKEFLTQELQKHLEQKSTQNYGALFCIDFTNFKLINDAHGHVVGDGVLQSVAKRLEKKFTEATLHARIGADEFVLWYKELAQTHTEASLQATEIAEEIVTLLSQPYIITEHTLHSIPCVGISLYDSTQKESAILIQQADAALHIAKQEQQSNISFFDTSAKELAKHHLELYTQLLHALKEEHFELFYQAQFDENEKICGAEALVRWRDPQRGLISPLEFIPIAEKTSLIIPLGFWILQTAIKQLALWQADIKTAHMTLAVNISAKQFYQEDFILNLKELIKEHAIKPHKLKLELTESLLVRDIETVIEKMQEIRSLGISLSLDDFGTGYSSLEYLKRLPLDQLKIDQSFVKNMLEERSDRAIIKTIISLAEAFELEVVAEGIETQEHYEALLALGCKIFQGYYFARPQRATEILEYF